MQAGKATYDGSVLLLEDVPLVSQWLVSDHQNLRYGGRFSTQYLATNAFAIDGKWLGLPDAVLSGARRLSHNKWVSAMVEDICWTLPPSWCML